MHYCLPGPVDAWSQLILNQLKYAPPSFAAGVAGGGAVGPRKPRRRKMVGLAAANSTAAAHNRSSSSRFFALDLDKWLTERGSAARLERCREQLPRELLRHGASLSDEEAHVAASPCAGGLSKMWWWPFHC